MTEKDLQAMKQSASPLTHWLVSLEGYPLADRDYYYWKVVIFPSDREGTFNWNAPLYRSPRYESFDEAYEAAVLLEKNCQNPEISMIDYLENPC
jgi:hypothetical protein